MADDNQTTAWDTWRDRVSFWGGGIYGGWTIDSIVGNSELYGDLIEGSEAVAQGLEGEPVLSAGARMLPLAAVTAPVVVGGLGAGKITEKTAQVADTAYQDAGGRVHAARDASADIVDAYSDEGATARGATWDAVHGFLQSSGESLHDRLNDAAEDYGVWEQRGAGAGLGTGLAASYMWAHAYPDLQEPIANDLAPVLDAVASVSPEVATAVPFLAVVGAGTVGGAVAGKGIGSGVDSLYDAVRNGDRDGLRDAMDETVATAAEYASWGREQAERGWDRGTELSGDVYEWAKTDLPDALQQAGDDLEGLADATEDGYTFVADSRPVTAVAESAPFHYGVRRPAEYATWAGKGAASGVKGYLHMKREHWGDKLQRAGAFLAPGTDDDEVK